MQDKPWIGAHTSAAGGVHRALYEGQAIGATTIQLFTSNQKQWKGKSLQPEEISFWQKALAETGLQHVMSHDSYLINLGSVDPELLEKSRTAFSQEIERCLLLGIPYLNFHPGAATKGSVEQCLATIIESLLLYQPMLEKNNLRLLLETTAGQGTTVGYQFEHLHTIIHAVQSTIPIGVCIDTCHIFAAGYDIRTESDWEKTLSVFDQIIGLEFLYAFHLNDSQKPIGSRVDRHAPLGKGEIGLNAFEYLMQNHKTRHLPKYLETPDGPEVWKQEILLLKNYYEN